jgi:hypothetical protein
LIPKCLLSRNAHIHAMFLSLNESLLCDHFGAAIAARVLLLLHLRGSYLVLFVLNSDFRRMSY